MSESPTRDPAVWFDETTTTSETLLVAFGGRAAGLGMPPFEFFKLLQGVPTRRMFVRDLKQAWYQLGLPGIANDPPGIAAFLAPHVRAPGVKRTVFIGNSMGGLAAILFGAWLEVDTVLAFSPQTFVDPARRLWHRDFRWMRNLLPLHVRHGVRGPYYDVKQFLQTMPGQRTRIQLHFDDTHRLDRLHCQRLQNFPQVALHAWPAGGHQLIKQLRDSGALSELLSAAVRGNPQDSARRAG